RTRLIQAGGIGHHTITRDGAVGGFQTADAAKGGRLTNGAARIRTCGGQGQPGRYSSGTSARGTAWTAALIPGVEYRPKIRTLVIRAHGKLVAIELAECNRPLGLQPLHNRGIKRALVVLQHLAGSSRWPV